MSKLNYICPTCKAPSSTLSEKVKDKLVCTVCGAEYRFIDGIARLTPENNYAESFGFQWNIFRKTQLDSSVLKPISEERLLECTNWSGDLLGHDILEAGSGAGRFTEVLVKSKANLYSFDFSNAVEANYLNNRENSNLTIFQGDIYNIPFLDKSFDHVLCLGVLQHTPDPKKSFFSLSEKVKEGGYLYIDIYTKSLQHSLQWTYLLRPLTKRLPKEFLFSVVNFIVPILIPPTQILKFFFGRFGARLSPIQEFSELDLGKENNKKWAILDTFDMYSPEHDHPKTKREVISWFEELNYQDITVFYGKNGVVGRGRKS